MSALNTVSDPISAVIAQPEAPARNRLLDSLRRHPTAIFGGTVLALMILMAIFAPWLGTTDPLALSPIRRLRPPGEQ